MATYDELFGKSDRRERGRFWTTGSIAVGDSAVFIASKEPYEEPEKEVNGSWEPLYLEKVGDSWKRKIESELTEGSDRMALTQIIVEAKTMDGEDVTLAFTGRDRKKALADAMKGAKLDLVPGTGIQITRGPNSGKMHTLLVKLAAPSE